MLIEKYKWSKEESQSMASFLLPMLEFYPHLRATASTSLQHPWLTDVTLKT